MEVGVGHLGRSPQFPEQDGQGDDGWARGHQPVSWATSHAVETADVNTGDYFKDKDTLLVLPISRVRKIIKQVNEVRSISAEAAFLIARATELLLDDIAARSAERVGSSDYLEYEHIAATIHNNHVFRFLNDVVPQKVSLKYLLDKLEQQDAFNKDGGGFECCMQLNSGSFYPPDKHLRKLDADNDKVGRIVVGTEENGGEHY